MPFNDNLSSIMRTTRKQMFFYVFLSYSWRTCTQKGRPLFMRKLTTNQNERKKTQPSRWKTSEWKLQPASTQLFKYRIKSHRVKMTSCFFLCFGMRFEMKLSSFRRYLVAFFVCTKPNHVFQNGNYKLQYKQSHIIKKSTNNNSNRSTFSDYFDGVHLHSV